MLLNSRCISAGIDYDNGDYAKALSKINKILEIDPTFEEVFRYIMYKCEGVIVKVGNGNYPNKRRTIRCKHCAEIISYIEPNNTLIKNSCPICLRAYPSPSVEWDSINGVEDMYRHWRGGDREFYLDYEKLFPEYEQSAWREMIIFGNDKAP